MKPVSVAASLVLLVIGTCSAQLSDEEIPAEIEIEKEYESPQPLDSSNVYFAEHFDDLANFENKWIQSEMKKEGIEEDIAKYEGVWSIEQPQKDGLEGDLGLVLKSKAKHAAISAHLNKPFVFNNKPLILQYEVWLQDGQECGGAYLKLLSQTSETKNLKRFYDKTPYTIMFGPDKCGNDHKLHFIFRHKNPVNGSIEEKHCLKPKERLEETFSDKLPHLYTLILKPDNTFEVQIDKKVIDSGSLLDNCTPPVNPPSEIEDSSDKKPDDWDEKEKIPDPNAVKPGDWDESAPAQIIDETATTPSGWLENEPTHIPDPNAQKPADWDTEMDGDWEPPLIENPVCASAPGCGPWEPPLTNNPAFKGKWRPPLIDNPNYKGKWKPRKIPNPDYFEDKEPFKMQTVSAIGFELWSMSKDMLFDNIILTEDIEIAERWTRATFDKKRLKIASESESVVQKLANLTNDYPYFWPVFTIVLSVPVVFILYLCCKPSSSQTKEQQKLLEQEENTKVIDEPTEDVTEETEDKKPTEVSEEEHKDDEDVEKNSDPDSEEDNEILVDSEQAATAVEGTRKRKIRKD